MYMSRLAALKEFAIMKALHENGFPVPVPVAQSRHTIVMSLVNAFPLRQISSVPDPAGLYAELLALIVRLAGVGLIHGDYNEFNILIEERRTSPDGNHTSLPDIEEEGELDALGNAPETEAGGAEDVAEPGITLVPTIIDFPQMVSIDHPNAAYYFDRDVACIKRFFSRRFGFTSDEPGPFFADSIKVVQNRLDIEVEASGFSRKMAKELDAYMKEVGADGVETEGQDDENDDESEPDEGVVPPQPEIDTELPVEAEDVISSQGGPVTAANLKLLSSSLVGGMEVLDIQDGEAVLELVPAVAPSDSPSTFSRRSAKAAAGWSI
jgi:RIO kinase 2